MFYNPTYPQRCEVVKVNGRAGAEMFLMAPNSSVLLLDESAPLVWLKTTDGAGYPTLMPYSIKPFEQKPPADLSEIIKRLDELEERVNEQSNTTDAKRTENADRSDDIGVQISGQSAVVPK